MNNLSKLDFAVIKQIGSKDELKEVAKRDAYSGWNGFTYYEDTVSFFLANKAEIIDSLKEMADSFGESLIVMVKGFGCFRDDPYLSEDKIAETIYGGEVDTTVANGLAWYALEETAHRVSEEA